LHPGKQQIHFPGPGIFQNQEMSWKKILPVKKIHFEQKGPQINIMPVEENFDCKRSVLVHSPDIPR